MSALQAFRPSRVEIAPGAITANVARLVELVAPAEVCAVVKADGYGHGAVLAAEAALAAGATRLATALVEEAVELRSHGIVVPVLVLSEPPANAWDAVAVAGLDAMVYRRTAVEAASQAAARAGVTLGLHLKVDTGMHRVGCAPPAAAALADTIRRTPGLHLAGLASHFAAADDHTSMFAAVQLERFAEVDAQLAADGHEGYLRHTANSAAALGLPAARLDMVRCGIACYGIAPSEHFTSRMEFDPAARVVSEVSFTKRLEAGEPVSYGCRYVTDRETTIATVPIGYADGVPRSLGLDGGAVLIGGRRHPVVGTVTMDQLMVDVGDARVVAGDEVVLVGEQGSEALRANEVASWCGSIGYELVARLGPRLPRVVV